MKFSFIDHNVSTTMNVFLVIANVINLFYNIPQMVTTYKRKSTKDFSTTFLVLRIVGNLIWIGYAIEVNSLLMMINNIVTVLSSIFISYYKVLEIISDYKKKNDGFSLPLNNVDNTTDLNKPISTLIQAALDVKENTSNKSATTTLGTSDVLFPTQNAVKTYVDAAVAGATIADGSITDAKIASVSAAKLTGILTVAKGGTGVGTITGIVKGNGTSAVTAAVNGTDFSLVREIADEFAATAGQTVFTLTQTKSANSKLKMFINGVRISNTAYALVGTTLTYTPASNASYALTLNDRIQFDYYY
jgi:uncharacterized protein with PQ loop repeat